MGMSENLTPDPDHVVLPVEDFTTVHGYDLAADPGLAQLQRYLPVLVVIAAPFASLGGHDEPLNPLDPLLEWNALLRAVKESGMMQKAGSTPLAVVRLAPPTSARLGEALSHRGADAFRVVHLICHGERDMLYLEDDDGSEAYAVAEHVVRLFSQSDARLVVMEGCFSRRLAQMLVEDTPVEAVVGSLRRVAPADAVAFNARFYATLTGGAGVREAFRAATGELKKRPDGQADRYELVIHDDYHEAWVPLPDPPRRAARPLVAPGGHPMSHVPEPIGFVGRRELLARLAGDVFEHNRRLIMLAGDRRVGKRWLAAIFAHRFGWRFPDGVLWHRCTPVTGVREVETALGRMMGLDPFASCDEIVAAFSGRQTLIILEHVDAIESAEERGRLGALLRDVLASGGHCVMMTARQSDKQLLPSGPAYEVRVRDVPSFSPRAARTLAMRRAVERGVEVLDVDTIDDFLECTRHVPWLIIKGVAMVERHGITRTLDDLKPLASEKGDLLRAYLRRRLEKLVIEQRALLKLLIRAQGLPGALDERLALGLTGANAAEHVAALVEHEVLLREGALYVVPDDVRAFIRDRFPLDAARQEHVDRVVLQYYAQTWPEETPDPLPEALHARLDNVRVLVARHLRPDSTVLPVIIARVLVAAAPAYVQAGLASSFVEAAQQVRERLAEGDDLARLQVATGRMLCKLPERREEAGWLFQVTLTLKNISRSTLADASLAYGTYLMDGGQAEAAADVLARAFKTIVSSPEGANVRLAAMLAYEWGRALIKLGQPDAAIKRFEGALAGYARTKQTHLSVLTQRDLAETLIATGDDTRAEDVLRRALATADFIVRRDLAAELRYLLSGLHLARADRLQDAAQVEEAATELGGAVRHLSEAVADLLTLDDSLMLARVLHRLAQAQARAGMMDDGAANAARSYALLARESSLPDLVDVAVTLGRLRMVQGDAIAAQTVLHDALDLGQALGDHEVMERAASVLVRVHQIRARHATQGDPAFRQDTLSQAELSRQRLAALGLGDHAEALSRVIRVLSALV